MAEELNEPPSAAGAPDSWPPAARYAAAVALTALLLALCSLSYPLIGGTGIPFLLMLATVVVTAAYAGVGPALVSLVISAAAGTYFIIGPAGWFDPTDPRRVMGLVVYLLVGSAAAVVTHGARRSARQAAAQARRARESEERLELARTAAGLGIYDVDFVAGVSTWDARMRALWGMAPDEPMTYAKALAAVHPEDRAAVDASVQRALDPRGDGRYAAEYRVIDRAGGYPRWLAATGQVFFRAGRAARMVGTVQDITARKDAEEQLRVGEERLRIAAETAGFGVHDMDVTTRTAIWSPELYAIAGVAPAHPVSTELIDSLIDPADRPRVAAAMRAALDPAGGGQLAQEYRIRRADTGEQRWVYNRARTFFGDVGGRLEATRSAGVLLDITERKQTEEAMRRQSELLGTITDTATTAILMVDTSGRVTFMNPAAEAMTGYTADEARGRVLHALAHHTRPDGRPYPQADCPIDRARTEQVAVHDHEDVWVRKDGSLFPVVINAVPVRGDDPSLGTVVEVRDISRQKDLEVERTAALQALQDANRSKDEFLAMLAHELRNPLAPIRNATRVLDLLGPDEPRIAAAREIIDRQVAHMARLVDDLLDVSRITRGKIELKMERLRLQDIIDAAVETSRPMLDAGRHALAVNAGPERWIRGDRARLVQVLSNLLTNAAKFTPPGGHIALRVTRHDDTVSLSVRDTGVGIPAGAEARIFDLFRQENVSLERSQGGLGIGLTLVKRLTEMHGGRVGVHSEGPGKGAEFTVTLPLLDGEVAPPAGAASATAARPIGPLRVLVVEDNDDAAASFQMLLDIHGHAVRVARDGVEALRVFEEFAPDVAFIDLGLPGIDGFGVAERIRAVARRHPVLIAVSGYGREEDKQRAHDAGFDAHMTKPVDHEKIEAILRRVGAEPNGAPAPQLH